MKNNIKRFEDLIAWQKGRALVSSVYRVARERPFSGDFALRNQICSAVISVPSNIAEGFSRYRLTEFHQFLSISKASCAEVRSQLYCAYDLEYIDNTALRSLLGQAEEVGRVIGGLRDSIERRRPLRTQHSGLRT